MRIKIFHRTSYTYDAPVSYGLQQIRLTPKARAGQRIIDWSIDVEGGHKELSFEDEHNNAVDLVRIDQGATELSIICRGEVETPQNDGILGVHGGYAPLWLFRRETPLTTVGDGVRAIIEKVRSTDNGIAQLHKLSATIRDQVSYETGTTGVETTAENAVESGHGVCQDHAHIFLAAARNLGYPARYVSGYLKIDDVVDQDATHAWAEAYVEGIGWIGFDVSNVISPDERYVRVATGLDYPGASPISGMRYGSASEKLHVDLQVQQQ
ncbi:MAG: transglutaminase family protein [Novosphingopyxis baekryungensis]|jgi:transglutaminase-like putative cysteine protease|nr:transglutaminase family protein [Novosphingopyxis baekryungensis]